MDEIAARRAFDNAIETYEQDFGKFFLARLYGLELEYTHDECRITFELRTSCSIRRAVCTAA